MANNKKILFILMEKLCLFLFFLKISLSKGKNLYKTFLNEGFSFAN